MANEVVRREAVEQTVEDMNEWVDELHTEIKDEEMALKASSREAEAANGKLDEITSIACTQLGLLKDIKLRLSETTDMLLYECHHREALERMHIIQLDIKRERQAGRRGGSGKWTVSFVPLICENVVNGTPP